MWRRGYDGAPCRSEILRQASINLGEVCMLQLRPDRIKIPYPSEHLSTPLIVAIGDTCIPNMPSVVD